MGDRRWLASALAALLHHPDLWPTAARQTFRLAAPGWWRRRPHLPIPPADYLNFRLVTMYGGDGEQMPDPSDLVTYLRWCREMATRP